MRKKFIRHDYMRYAKIGKNRKKIQKWRKPKGRHNKMREKREGYPDSPGIGYKKPRALSGRIAGKAPIMVYNVNDLNKTSKDSIIILGKVGAKKKMEIIKKADEMKMTIFNLAKEAKKNAAK